uniref:Uncharacterized protein n=1 Tax=Romanomermis culicivorax TaxID=13658 RepID=A0A915L978_ROMCU
LSQDQQESQRQCTICKAAVSCQFVKYILVNRVNQFRQCIASQQNGGLVWKKRTCRTTTTTPGSYFCLLLGEHAQRATLELCSEVISEHSIEQAARRACSA